MLTMVVQTTESAPICVSLSDWIQLGMVLVTFFAVIIALFQERIRQKFNRASLNLGINLVAPDCHLIDLTDPSGKFVCKCIYLRIRVSNVGNITANDVEVIASNLWKTEAGNRILVKTFLPMNLRWSHTHPTKVTIPTRSFRFCDLGPIRPLNNIVILKFDTEVQPNPVSGGVYPNILESGIYELELLLTGDNVNPVLSRWEVIVPDVWTDIEDKMLDLIQVRRIGQ